MTGYRVNRGPRRGASVQAGPDKHMGIVLEEVLRTEEGWQSESPGPYKPSAPDDTARRLEDLRSRLAAGGLPFSTEEMVAIAHGRYVPIETAEFLSRVGGCVRPAKESFRALAQQCAFDIVAARLGSRRACTLFGWE
jgi:hypothetical protein